MLKVGNNYNELKEYERQISQIKILANPDNKTFEELMDVLTKYVLTYGGTYMGALHYVNGQLMRGETLNNIIEKLRNDLCEAQ